MSNVEQQQQAADMPPTRDEIAALSARYLQLEAQAYNARCKILEAIEDTKAAGSASGHDDEDGDVDNALLLDLLRPAIELAEVLTAAAAALEVPQPMEIEVRVEIYDLASRGHIALDRYWSVAYGWDSSFHLRRHLQAVEGTFGRGPISMVEEFGMRGDALRAFCRQVEGWVQEQV